MQWFVLLEADIPIGHTSVLVFVAHLVNTEIFTEVAASTLLFNLLALMHFPWTEEVLTFFTRK